MDEHIVDLMRDQFKALSDKVDGVHDIVKEHVNEDKRYWQKIDQQQGQMSLIKALLGASGLSALITWVYNVLKH
jgi:hypothetical protein